MGYWKNRQAEREEANDWARRLLCDAEALRECEVHGTFYDGPKDVQEAYILVNSRIKSGQITLKNGQTSRDLTDLIQKVYADNSSNSRCPIYEKNFGGDD
jgi:hypothetical protein